jgi:DNA mismatch repair protein MutL
MPLIRPLTTDVIHLIAAVEVIDSLGAIVRELVENALDAGADRLVVNVSPEHWRVRVADNGSGMDLADLRCCATPHSTSKIHDRQDLNQITTLGFRGEGLHSLATLADLEILSRTEASNGGWRVVYDQLGEVVIEAPAAIAPGTVVTVSNLFSNWLQHREALPSAAQQLRLVQNTLWQIALCHPHVTWQIQKENQPWFTISPGQSPKEILLQVLHQVQPSDLQYLQLEVPLPSHNVVSDQINYLDQGLGKDLDQALDQGFNQLSNQDLEVSREQAKILLVLGLPDRASRRRPDWVRVAINGRVIKSPELEQAIFAGMARTLPRDRYPICFLHLHIPPAQVDWNRHPAKAEIFLHHVDHWQAQIKEAIAQALSLTPQSIPEATYSQRIGKLITAAEASTSYRTITQVSDPIQDEDAVVPDDLYNPSHSDSRNSSNLKPLKALAQVHNTYIVAEHNSGLWLVEQHIAHERVLYEQLVDRWQLLPLEMPVILSHLTPRQVEYLEKLELDIASFGEQLWAVRTAPAPLVDREDCAAALMEISQGGDLQTAQVAIACRTAIRNGTPLTLPEMQTLLDQWQNTRHPRTCPHGRPIYLPLEETNLSRFFRRHWVIGKSHGL